MKKDFVRPNLYEKITDNLIIAIIIHIYIGWGFLYLVDTAVGHLTNNAYLGIFPAMLLIIPFFLIAADLGRMYPNQKISAIFGEVFGQYVGKAVGIIYVIFLIFFLAVAQRNTQLMVSSYFFLQTPLWLISLLFLGGTLYSALKGIKSVGRLAAFMLIPPLILIFGLEILGLKNINPFNVQPILAGAPGQWLATTLDLTLILLPGTAIFVFMPFIQNVKSILKISFISLGVILPVFFVALLGVIGIFGPALIPKMSWGIVEYFHRIDYPYLLLEQAGMFFLIAWYPFHLVSTAQGLFVISNELNDICPLIKREWLILGIGILVFGLVNLPINVIVLAHLFTKYRRWFTFSYLSVFLVTWLTARLRVLLKTFHLIR